MTTPKFETNTGSQPRAARSVPVLRYRPDAEGLERWFGPLETEIMEVMWRATRPMTVKRVHTDMPRDLAYTTIMTTMARLWEKGVLAREKDGLAYSYTPTCSEAEFVDMQIRAIADSIEADLAAPTRAQRQEAR